MRSYLVVMDDSEEAQAALRYAARRAARTGGGVEILALIPRPEFSQWGAVQAAIEEDFPFANRTPADPNSKAMAMVKGKACLNA